MRFGKFLRAKLGKEEGWDEEVLTEAMDKFEKTVGRQQIQPSLAVILIKGYRSSGNTQ